MGKMKDISIELEEAGLDHLDNSNINRYVDDTHHFGEEIIKSPVTLNEQYGAYGIEELYPHRINIDLTNPTFRDAMSIKLGKCINGLSDAELVKELNRG